MKAASSGTVSTLRDARAPGRLWLQLSGNQRYQGCRRDADQPRDPALRHPSAVRGRAMWREAQAQAAEFLGRETV
jgi:hypothetical protein